ncbi:unnamed protein product [Ilex paraguariensis]|uniref:Uncharacterized protein n=1 Tax=Ilex paraguariensis TaxID=185542 RepID=A0ABC8S952_9AQUA
MDPPATDGEVTPEKLEKIKEGEPTSVALDIRRELVDYLTQRSETFVAEFVVLEGGPDAEESDNPYDIISNFVDDFEKEFLQ